MDQTDRRITDFLREDGRASNRAVADAFFSPRLVGSRIDSMLRGRELRIAGVADVFEAANDPVLDRCEQAPDGWGGRVGDATWRIGHHDEPTIRGHGRP